MRLILIVSVIAAGLAIAWLWAGRQITSLLDRFITLRLGSLPVSPLKYDVGDLVIGQLRMTFGSTDNQRSSLCLCSDSRNQVILKAGARSFTLGLRTNPIDPKGRPDIDFVAAPGDELSLTARRSVVGWPTPFEYHIMIRSPRWKRYVYCRLVWKKPDGAKLEMLWRYEQEYYRPGGWTDPLMMWNWHTGLIRIDILPPTAQLAPDRSTLPGKQSLGLPCS